LQLQIRTNDRARRDIEESRERIGIAAGGSGRFIEAGHKLTDCKSVVFAADCSLFSISIDAAKPDGRILHQQSIRSQCDALHLTECPRPVGSIDAGIVCRKAPDAHQANRGE